MPVYPHFTPWEPDGEVEPLPLLVGNGDGWIAARLHLERVDPAPMPSGWSARVRIEDEHGATLRTVEFGRGLFVLPVIEWVEKGLRTYLARTLDAYDHD